MFAIKNAKIKDIKKIKAKANKNSKIKAKSCQIGKNKRFREQKANKNKYYVNTKLNIKRFT